MPTKRQTGCPMPRDISAGAQAAQRVGFADLFDAIGSDNLGYGEGARRLSGTRIVIEGYLSHAHGPDRSVSLVPEPGLCPDCAGVPVAVIALPDLRLIPQEGDRPVQVAGRLDYGLRIIRGTASMLRIEDAVIVETADAT
jgi:hypothetical protein